MAKPRILIVEDETIVARDIGEQLTEQGYEPVGYCIRGEETLEAAKTQQADLVLMDIHLAGGMDGIEAAGLIRDELDVPVVFLTAFGEQETFDRAKGADPFGYIVKPFNPSELRTVIEIALFKHETGARLRESEELYRHLVESSIDAVLLTDPASRILRANTAACVMFKATEAELLEFRREDIVDLSDPRVVKGLEERSTEGKARAELTLLRRDKTKFPAEVSSVICKTADGLIRSSMVIRDLTEKKLQELELELKSAALAAAANAIIITNCEGEVTWANEAFSTLTGYDLSETIGRNPKDLIKSGQHSKEFYQGMWESIKAGKVWNGEVVNRRKDGSLYHESMTITPMRNAEGEIKHFIAIKQDISERIAAEERLRESEERYRMLFDDNPLPMWLYDCETLQFIAVNDTAVRNYGFTREEFLDLKITRIHSEEDSERFQAMLQENRQSSPSENEWRHQRKDGTVFPVSVNARPLEFQGRSARLVIAEDISEKKELQDKFLRAQRLESLGMLASGIAHDLNNVLAPVLFTAPLLRNSVPTERDQKILNMLEKSAERGTGLVRQILSFAHGASEARRITQVKHIGRDVVDVLKVTLPRSIKMESRIDTDLWPVEVNPTQIHQVLLNLGVNARDAMPNGGVLTIAMFNRSIAAADTATPNMHAGNWLVIEVTDTGTGMPPDVLAKIWDAFFTTKIEGKGTGLGLSTVRSIVDGHSGFVQVETEMGEGTTFRIFLPVNEVVDLAETSPQNTEVGQGRDELILVVDDDSTGREVTQAVLMLHGYKVIVCADGIEALVHYSTNTRDIALVITDVDMPNLNGAVLLSTLRELAPDLRAIAMSGLESDVAGSSAVGDAKKLANAFLTKPFTADILLKTVQEVLGHK